MDGGGAGLVPQRPQAGDQHRRGSAALARRSNQEARAGDRRERHRDLELRVITPAGAVIGIGPGMVEDIFAHGMGLEIAGRGAEELFRVVLDQHMHGRPAGLCTDAAGILERREEGVRDEGVERIVVAVACAEGAGIPVRSRDRFQALGNFDLERHRVEGPRRKVQELITRRDPCNIGRMRQTPS